MYKIVNFHSNQKLMGTMASIELKLFYKLPLLYNVDTHRSAPFQPGGCSHRLPRKEPKEIIVGCNANLVEVLFEWGCAYVRWMSKVDPNNHFHFFFTFNIINQLNL
jgi:hypothetical protein